MFAKDKNYRKFRDHCDYAGKSRDAAHSICNLRFNMPNKVPVVFHNGSNHEYHLENEFKEKIVLGRAKKKEKQKEITKIDKYGHESVVTTSYKKSLLTVQDL